MARNYLKYCNIHEVFYLREYPHICDGIMPPEVIKRRSEIRAQGWKKGRKK